MHSSRKLRALGGSGRATSRPCQRAQGSSAGAWATAESDVRLWHDIIVEVEDDVARRLAVDLAAVEDQSRNASVVVASFPGLEL